MLYVIHVMPKSSKIDLCNFPIRCTTVALGTSKCFQLKVFVYFQKGKVHHSTQLIMNLLGKKQVSIVRMKGAVSPNLSEYNQRHLPPNRL